MSNGSRTAGFTLVELLVAITLASLVAVLGAVVLRAALDFHARATGHLKEGEDLRAADRLLAREWSARRGEDVVATATELEFQSDRFSGPYAPGQQGAIRVGYFCSEDDAGRMVLQRRLLVRAEAGAEPPGGTRSPQAGAPDAKPGAWRVLRTEVLMPRLAACSFGYLRTRESRDARIAEWRGEVGAGQPAPRLIRLRLATERGELAPLVYGIYGAEG